MEREDPVDLSTAKVISDTFFVSASRIGMLLLKPIRGFIIGRLLGPSLYGLLNIPVPYVDIFKIFSNIGFNTSVVRLIPGYRQKGRADLASMIYRSTAVLTVTLSVAWSILLLFSSRWIVGNLAHEPDAINPMRVYALVIPFLALNAFYAAVFLAFQRGKLRAAITVVHGVLNVLLPILAILWRRNVTLVIAGFLTAEVIAAVLFSIVFHRKILRGLSRTVGPLLRGIREVFRFGFLFFFADLGWNMINSVDRLMVKYFLPVDMYGFYSMAALVITALTVVASTAGVALVPSLTAAKESGDEWVFKKQIGNTARLGFIVLVPVAAVIYVLAGDIFSIILPRFMPSVSVIRILVFIGFVLIFCRTAWAALVAYGRGGAAATAYITAACWNLLWNWILIPRYGIAGAAIATLSTFIILAAALQVMMFRTSRTVVGFKSLLHPLILSAAFPMIGMLLRGQGSAVRILTILVTGSAIYIILSLLTGLVRREDLAGARNALNSRRAAMHVRLAIEFIDLLDALSRKLSK